MSEFTWWMLIGALLLWRIIYILDQILKALRHGSVLDERLQDLSTDVSELSHKVGTIEYVIGAIDDKIELLDSYKRAVESDRAALKRRYFAISEDQEEAQRTWDDAAFDEQADDDDSHFRMIEKWVRGRERERAYETRFGQHLAPARQFLDGRASFSEPEFAEHLSVPWRAADWLLGRLEGERRIVRGYAKADYPPQADRVWEVVTGSSSETVVQSQNHATQDI